MKQAISLPKSLPQVKPKRSWLASIQPYLYLLPALITVGIWVYLPLAQTIGLSFYQWNLLPTTPKLWVGLENYQALLGLPELKRALFNTLVYIVGTLPMSVLLPLVVALLTENIRGRAKNLYRVLIFLPMIMAPVIVSVVWRWLLAPSQGLLSETLQHLGLGVPNFFRDPKWAIWTIIFITGWKLIGFSTILFSAAIAGIDRRYLEAARLDGATEWQVARYITLPLVSPTTLFLVMLTVLLGAQWSFAYINVITQGGPLGSTTNIYFLLWQYGFSSFNIGWGSAAAVLLLLGFGLIAFVGLRLMNRYSFYDS